MKPSGYSRRLGSLITICAFVAAGMLGGCADNSAGPVAEDGLPPGLNGTVLISDPVSQQEADDVRSNIDQHSDDTVVLSSEEAIRIALEEDPGAELLGCNLDYDSDTLSYECVIRSGGKTYVVVISPKDGKVRRRKQVSNAYYTTIIIIRQIKVRVKEAKQKAKQLIKNTRVVECNLEQIDGRPTYIIILLDNSNRYITIYLDADDGRERKLDDDGKCDDEKKKNKKGRGHYRHGKGKGYGHHYHCHCDCDNDDDDNDDNDTTEVRDSLITLDSAKVIAALVLDSATVTGGSLDSLNDSTAYYRIDLTRDSNTYQVKIDGYTGRLAGIEQTGGNFDSTDYQPGFGDTLVALSIARTAALAQVPGIVTGWKLEKDSSSNKWIYTIKVQPTGTTLTNEIEVDAKTGTFIRIK